MSENKKISCSKKSFALELMERDFPEFIRRFRMGGEILEQKIFTDYYWRGDKIEPPK